MENQNTPNSQSPWYVRYHIIPDPKKPRTPLMGLAHGYVSFLLAIWIIGLAVGGVALIISDQSFGSIVLTLLCFAGSYAGFRFFKHERARSRERQQRQ